MIRFSYTLNSVLKARRLMADVREAELAAESRVMQQQEQRLQQLDDAIVTARNSPIDSTDIAAFCRQRERHTLHLQHRRRRQHEAVQVAAENVETCRQAWADAQLQLRLIERHRDRERRKWRHCANRHEQKQTDDLVLGTRPAVGGVLSVLER